ncbi:MAG: hypothetical protein MAG451_02892 [Anaerolineales bacterium]|nr:hypothetical protein [Anaerolineales bacterium]
MGVWAAAPPHTPIFSTFLNCEVGANRDIDETEE